MQANPTVIPDSVNRFLKFYSLIEKIFWRNNLYQTICSKYVFRLLHAPKFQIFFTKLNIMVKIVKLFTVVLRKAILMIFIGKNLYRSLFFNKAALLQAKKRLLHSCFPVISTKYFRTHFLKNTTG